MMFRVLSVVLPQIGVKYLDPNDMSSIPEEVCIHFTLVIYTVSTMHCKTCIFAKLFKN